MPLSAAPPDVFLPHIDTHPSESSLASARALITASLAPSNQLSTLHPSLPPLRETKFTPSILSAHESLSTQGKIPWTLDFIRYEQTTPEFSSSSPETRRSALALASTNLEYLSLRKENLSLLETYGKNAWLIGNSGLEDELRALERELEAAKIELEEVEAMRRARQEGAASEIRGLEEGWRKGVGRMIETLAAGERVRGEVLGVKRRMGAGVGG